MISYLLGINIGIFANLCASSSPIPMNKIILRNHKEKAVLRKHPWIFSGAIDERLSDPCTDGDWVSVHTSAGQIAGFGLFSELGSIRVRMLSFGKEPPSFSFWEDRLASAWQLRVKMGVLEQCNAFRWVHGEGDGLPGLIIDYYAGHAVLQPHFAGMAKHAERIAKAMEQAVPELQTIYLKAPDAGGTREGSRFLLGDMSSAEITENGVRFEVNWVTGQKTGFFLDQRENRALVQRLSQGKRVLNGFAYTGGFSMAAWVGGASEVVSADISNVATDLCLANEKLNKPGNKKAIHRVETVDVLKFLKEDETIYDVVIVDPPAFAKSLQKKHSAIQGYKRLNAMAFQRVADGGLMFTFSCSQVIDRETFKNTITAAGIEAGCEVQIMHELSQGPDHPVGLYHPEGHYLKGLVLHVKWPG